MTGVERLVVRLMADATNYNRVFNAAETRLLTFASAATAAAIEAGRAALTLASQWETVGVAFEVMTGSAEKAASMMKQLQEFAIATPFTFGEVSEGARRLHAMGVELDNVLPSLKAVSEVVAGLGGDQGVLNRVIYNFGQVMSQGFASWVDIRQFAMAGVEIKEFARTAGVSVSQLRAMSREGGISADIIVQTFNRMTQAGGKFHGLMDKMAGTAAGQWNAIKESFGVVLRDIGTAMITGMKKSGFLDYLLEVFQAAKTEGSGMEAFWTNFFSVLKGMVVGIVELGRNLKVIFDGLGKTISGFTGLFSDVKMSAIDLGAIIIAIPGYLMDAFLFVRNGINFIILAIVSVIEKLQDLVLGLWDEIKDLAAWVGIGSGAGPRDKTFLAIYREELIATMKADVRAMGSGERMAAEFKRKWAEAGKGVKDVKHILGEIGAIRIPEPFLPPDLMKFVEGVEEGFGKGGFDDFSRKLTALQKARWTPMEMLPGGLWSSMINPEQFNFGAMKLFNDLKTSVKDRLETKLPTVALKGSAEAQDTINKSNLKQLNVQEEILRVLEATKEAELETARRAKEIGDILDRLLDKGGIIKKKL